MKRPKNLQYLGVKVISGIIVIHCYLVSQHVLPILFKLRNVEL